MIPEAQLQASNPWKRRSIHEFNVYRVTLSDSLVEHLDPSTVDGIFKCNEFAEHIRKFKEANDPQAADFAIIETPLSADKIICLGAELEILINLSIDDVVNGVVKIMLGNEGFDFVNAQETSCVLLKTCLNLS